MGHIDSMFRIENQIKQVTRMEQAASLTFRRKGSLQEGIYILFYALLQCKGILVEGREGQ
jgi:hypothetical protein